MSLLTGNGNFGGVALFGGALNTLHVVYDGGAGLNGEVFYGPFGISQTMLPAILR